MILILAFIIIPYYTIEIIVDKKSMLAFKESVETLKN
jgi:hypothetical protein